jgi:uncharacterized membrane protein (DUF485 family)
MDSAQHFAREKGPALITFLKLIFILCFIVLAIVDRDITWFKKQPGKTIGEALVAGFGAAASFAILGYMRGAPGLRKLFLISLGVFASLQILFELSGFNELKATANTAAAKFSEDVSKFKKNKIVWALGLIVFIVLFSFMICAWDTPFPNAPWARTTKQFLMEMAVIGLGSALPSIMVTKNRGGSAKEVMTNFAAGFFLFGVLAHPSLQYSGVYREIGLWKDGRFNVNIPSFS